jgi:hypothetical protein
VRCFLKKQIRNLFEIFDCIDKDKERYADRHNWIDKSKIGDFYGISPEKN